MCHKCHKCFITVEVLTAGDSISLPDNNQINKGRITSIQMRRSGTGTLKSSTGKTLATDAVVGTAHITLKNSNGVQIFAPLPLSTLQRDYNSPEPMCVNIEGVDLAQSPITLDGAAATATHVFEIIFGLECDKC